VAATVAYHLGWLRGGFLGVDVFFVLSGFLVTSLLLAEVESASGTGPGRSVDLRAFWGARLRRLTPAVVVVTPTVLWAARAVGWPESRLDELAVDGAATLSWWQNWRQILAGQSYWDPAPSPFRHAWSLAIEEQYYLVWPVIAVVVVVIVGVLGHRRSAQNGVRPLRAVTSTRFAVGAIAAFGAGVSALWHVVLARRLDASELSRVYLGTDTRAFAILIGCATACSPWGLRPSDRPAGHSGATVGRGGGVRAVTVIPVLTLVGAMATVRVDDARFFRYGGFVAVALLASMVVAGQADRPGPGSGHGPGSGPGRRAELAWIGSGLGTGLSWLGTRSYAIYLWSWPMQVLAAHRWPDTSRWLLSVGVVGLSLGLAELSHRFVEDPLRRRDRWASQARRRRPAWVVGSMVAVASVVGTYGAASVAPAHQRLDTAEALERALAVPTTAPAGTAGEDGLGVLVTGDSVSFTIGLYKPEPEELPNGLKWVDSRAVIGCGLLAADRWEYPDGSGGFAPPSSGDCVGQAEAERRGLAQRPDVVVTFPGAWETQAARSPEGEVVTARSTRMAEVLTDNLVTRALDAHRVGSTFIVVAWACPGEGTPSDRSDPEFISWVDRVFRSAMERARRAGADARYLEPGPESCEGGITGTPTEDRRRWMADSNHVLGWDQGKAFWNEWLGPKLVDEMASR